MSAQSSAQQVVLVGPNGQAEAVSLEKLDTYASLLEAKSDAFSNISKAGDVLSDMYDKTEAALASTYDNASQVVSEGYTSAADWAGNTSDAAKQWGQDTYEVAEQWGVETADATRTKVIQLSEDAQLKWDAFKKEAEIAKEQAAKKAEALATKTGEYIDAAQSKAENAAEKTTHWYQETFGNKGIDFGGSSSATPMDPQTGQPNCDCKTVEPCCVYSGKIADGDQEARFIKWPNCKKDPKNLLLIAKDLKGLNPGGSVKIELKGKNNSNCQKRYDYHPSLVETVSGDKEADYIVQEKSDRTVHYDKATLGIGFTSIICDAAIIGSYLVISKAWELYDENHLKNRYAYKINQCATNNTMSQQLGVVPVPYLRLSGDVKIQPVITINSSGISMSDRKTWPVGNIQGQYCDFEFSRQTTLVKAERGEDDGADDNAPFGIWLLDKVYEAMRFLTNFVGTPPPEDNSDKPLIGVTIKPYLGMSTAGLELKKVGEQPDLLLEMGNVAISFGVSAMGTLNLVDLVLKLVTGGSSTILLKIKEKIDRAQEAAERVENYIPGEFKLVAELTFSAEASYGTETGPAMKVKLLSDGKKEVEGLTYERENKIEIRFAATAEITLRIKAEVYILEAALGVYGSLNTGWNFQFKSTFENGVKEDYKRYFFEGIKLKAGIAFEISAKDYDDTGDGIGNQIQSDTKSGLAETEAYLMKPTVDEVTDNIPAWIKE